VTISHQKKRNTLASKRRYLEARATILESIREYFKAEGFLEVETPQRIKAPAPEKYIDTEVCGDHFLIASPELQMKQLICSGYERVFQICHCFRSGERGPRHLSEFTMLEWYRSGEGEDALMTDCEKLLALSARRLGVFPLLPGGCVNVAPPFERLTVADAFERAAGWRPGPSPDQLRFDMDLVDRVEPSLSLSKPVFLTDYPRSMASLARISPRNPDTAQRFELYAGGLELANGYAELTDPVEQRTRFELEEQFRRSEGKPPYPLDEEFLGALELGMKECSGIALGVDRLVMLLTGAPSIDHVVAFTDG